MKRTPWLVASIVLLTLLPAPPPCHAVVPAGYDHRRATFLSGGTESSTLGAVISNNGEGVVSAFVKKKGRKRYVSAVHVALPNSRSFGEVTIDDTGRVKRIQFSSRTYAVVRSILNPDDGSETVRLRLYDRGRLIGEHLIPFAGALASAAAQLVAAQDVLSGQPIGRIAARGSILDAAYSILEPALDVAGIVLGGVAIAAGVAASSPVAVAVGVVAVGLGIADLVLGENDAVDDAGNSVFAGDNTRMFRDAVNKYKTTPRQVSTALKRFKKITVSQIKANPWDWALFVVDQAAGAAREALVAGRVRLGDTSTLFIRYSWPATQRDLDTHTESRFGEVGFACGSSAPFTVWSSDDTGFGGTENVSIDLGGMRDAGELGANFVASCHAGWYEPAGGSGPATLEIAVRDLLLGLEPLPSADVVRTSVNPGRQNGCAATPVGRILMSYDKILGEFSWSFE